VEQFVVNNTWCRCVVQTRQVSKLLKYLSGLSTTTSDAEPSASAQLLSNTAGVSAYFTKLEAPPVSVAIRYVHTVS